MVIWKYELELTDEQDISMPLGASILSAQIQEGKICVWAVVNPNGPSTPTKFYIFGTGEGSITSPMTFVDTVQDGPFVWHVFCGLQLRSMTH